MKYIINNGRNVKSVDNVRDSWDFIEQLASRDIDLFGKVSAVFRSANITADALSALPFAIIKNGNEIDNSLDYKNAVGFLPNPREMLRLWRLSLYMTNTAYGRMVKTNAIKRRLIYVSPETIKIITDRNTGQIEKLIRNNQDEYLYNDPALVHLWRQDYSTEILPSKNTELMAVSNSAGLVYAMDFWARNFFERGGIKPSIIAVKGMLQADKKDELQSSWGKFIRNIGRELTKIINADVMDIKQIGDGIGDLGETPVYRQALENIAMASGIPLSLLLSNSANYATAQAEYSSWYRDSIIPWAQWIQEQLNEQLFKPAGYYFEFRPEIAEPSQQEEVERANAYRTYIQSGMLPSIAAQIVGIDLPAGVEYESLDPKPEPQPEPQQEQEQEQPEAQNTMSFEAWKEYDIWKRKALKASRLGKQLPVDFICNHIPAGMAEGIRNHLRNADTELAFGVDTDSEITKLAEAINRLADEQN